MLQHLCLGCLEGAVGIGSLSSTRVWCSSAWMWSSRRGLAAGMNGGQSVSGRPFDLSLTALCRLASVKMDVGNTPIKIGVRGQHANVLSHFHFCLINSKPPEPLYGMVNCLFFVGMLCQKYCLHSWTWRLVLHWVQPY